MIASANSKSKTLRKAITACLLLVATVASSVTGYASIGKQVYSLDVNGYSDIEPNDEIYGVVCEMADKDLIDSSYFCGVATYEYGDDSIKICYGEPDKAHPSSFAISVANDGSEDSKEMVQYYNKAYFNGKLSEADLKSKVSYGVLEADKNATYNQVAELAVRCMLTLEDKVPDDWNLYFDALYYAKDKGLLLQDEALPFCNTPNQMTRGEAIELFSNLVSPYMVKDKVNDVSAISGNVSDSVKSFYEAGILLGDGNGNFNEDKYITKAELLVLADRVLEPTHRIKVNK